jgi:hypothetical protein
MKHLLFAAALLAALPAHAQTVTQRQARADDRSGVVYRSRPSLPYQYASSSYFTSAMVTKRGGVAARITTTPFSHPGSNSSWLWRHLPLVDHTHDDCDYAKRDCGVAK